MANHPLRFPTFEPPTMRLEFDPIGSPAAPWIALCDHTFHDGLLFFKIPARFKCDLASVPRLLMLFFPPNGKHQRAAMFHDAAYSRQNTRRFAADAMFRIILSHDGVSLWRRLLLYYGVRAFGWLAWWSHKKGKA